MGTKEGLRHFPNESAEHFYEWLTRRHLMASGALRLMATTSCVIQEDSRGAANRPFLSGVKAHKNNKRIRMWLEKTDWQADQADCL